MGQYWNIICVDKREATGHLGKMGELIHDNVGNWIKGIIMVGRFPEQLSLSVKLTKNLQTKTLSLFEQLPFDLLFHIFAALWTTKDILRLSLTCYHLLITGQKFIMANVGQLTAPWAGKRLVCLGDYAYDSLPEGMLNQAEIAKLNGEELYNAGDSYDKPTKSLTKVEYFSGVTKSFKFYNVMKELLGHNIILYPAASAAVLRNKTLKVYVRESQIPVMKKKVVLGVVLILQICWSTDPSMSLYGQDEGQEQGPWAGHRFDITWDDQVDESWTDVSEDVFERLHTVLVAEFGH